MVNSYIRDGSSMDMVNCFINGGGIVAYLEKTRRSINWIEHWSTKPEVVGSNPTVSAKI